MNEGSGSVQNNNEHHRMWVAFDQNILAEREGFEPSKRFYPFTTLAVWCFRPLSHLSSCASIRRRWGLWKGESGSELRFCKEGVIQSVGCHDVEALAVQLKGFVEDVHDGIVDQNAAHALEPVVACEDFFDVGVAVNAVGGVGIVPIESQEAPAFTEGDAIALDMLRLHVDRKSV